MPCRTQSNPRGQQLPSHSVSPALQTGAQIDPRKQVSSGPQQLPSPPQNGRPSGAHPVTGVVQSPTGEQVK